MNIITFQYELLDWVILISVIRAENPVPQLTLHHMSCCLWLKHIAEL